VKYVVLIYSNPATWESFTKDELDGLMGEFDAQQKELTGSGEFVEGAALADPSTARTIRVRGGVPATTDGPFAESKEQLAGYFVIDCESFDRAVEIASKDPNARIGAVEVRPIMDTVGGEM
jgi:hypothetical protein